MKAAIWISIFTAVSFAACRQPVPASRIINQEASLPQPFQLNSLRVIASSINKKHHTMATLYGNDVSIRRARSGAPIAAGEKLVLVTWQQKADESWFGANIPGKVESVEEITTADTPAVVIYHLYKGRQLVLSTDTIGESRQINRIFGIQASIMP